MFSLKYSEKSVGAWLASDAGDAVFLLNRVDTFAGKPAPTGIRAHKVSP